MLNSIEKPQWKLCYHVEVLDERAVLLVDEKGCTLLDGRVYPLLAPLLDGKHTLDDLFDRLGDKVFFPEIAHAVRHTVREGHVVEGGPAADPGAAFWHALDAGTRRVEEALSTTGVSLLTLTSPGMARALTAALGKLGISAGISAGGGAGGFLVVLTDDYLHPELGTVNEAALESGTPWLLARPSGNTVWIGPVFRPGSTACYECLAQRLRCNRQVEGYLEKQRGNGSRLRLPRSAVPTLVEGALQMVATEAAKAIVLGERNLLDGKVLTLDLVAMATTLHEVVRRPQCRACGHPDRVSREPRRVELTPTPRRAWNDGGVRTCTPEVTYERLKKHVSPISGVVRTLEPTGRGRENGLTFSFAAGHNFALMSKDLRFFLQNLRGRSGGKGVTEAQAKVSAICEAIERYSGVYREGETVERVAAYDDLAGEAIHPNELMCFSDAQYAGRAAWNERHESGFHKVPERFDPARPVHWTPAWSLTRERFAWVPSPYVYFGHPELHEWFYCTSDSNGNAAGNTLEEAILQGFFELIERDAVAVWWYNRIQRPALDLASFEEPYLEMLVQHYSQQQRELWVLDITSDFGIPTFAAVSRRLGHPVEDIVVGFGAHFEPRIALLRAVTEINQFMPAVENRDPAGNTIYWFPEPEAVRWFKTGKLEENLFLAPAPLTLRRMGDFTTRSSPDIADDVRTCAELVRERGLEMLVVDQTQPDIGVVGVAKVMVPGMRHFWKRFGPGRLYDVPVRLGWLAAPRREDELNPTGIFF